VQLLNIQYQNKEDLVQFIQDKKIKNCNSNLIQIFSSGQSEESISNIRDILKEQLPDCSIIGTTTAGIIDNNHLIDNQIVISFSIFKDATVNSISYCKISNQDIIDDLSKKYIQNDTKLLIIFANTFRFNSENFLKQLTSKFPHIVIAGGNAADDYKFEECYTLSDKCKDCDVAIAIINSQTLQVETKYLLNWHTLGKDMIVTKSKDSTVYEINNKKALDIYREYLGEEIASNMLTYGIEFPLIYNQNETSIARAAVAVDETQGSITFAGDIDEGSKVKFGYANIDYITNQNKVDLQKQFNSTHEAIYIYSCGSRRQMLGSFLNDEIATINQIAPTTGFITYGEFFHNSNSCHNDLLNITTTYVVLNENNTIENNLKFTNITTEKNKHDIVLKALTNLITKTSNELDENLYYLEQFKNAVNEAAIFSITDSKGKIKEVNKNFEIISGYKEEELIGKSHNIVRSPDMPNEVFKDMWETIQSGKLWKGLVKNRKKDGKPYHVLSEILPIYYKNGDFREYIGIRNDVTELEEYKLILKHELDTKSKNLEENLHYTSQYELAVNTTTAILKTDTQNIITYANDTFCKISGYSYNELIGKSCKDLRHNKHIISHKCDQIKEQLAKKQIVTEVLTNISKDGEEYTVSNLFYPITNLNADVIEHLQVMHDITEIIQLTQEIVDTQKEVVLTMGAIGETRSKETGLHVKRVAEYSYLFAILYGLDEDDAQLLKQASPMHDIGKVGIPDSILNKPGKLTSEEFSIMKTHAQIGYEMLKHSKRDILKTSAIVALNHHEKWDGSGYPNQLKGKDIHIFGRITAIADVFDALGHDRCYKKAWADEDIFTLFKEQKGKHFEPRLVELFFDNQDLFLDIRTEFQDIIE